MDDRRVGRVFREVRLARRLRQVDVAAISGVSQRHVSQIELGRLEAVSLPALRRVAAALDIRVELDPRWQRGDAHRLADRRHAALVEHVVGQLRSRGWEVLVEETFNFYGERGSVDVVGWHAETRTLLLVEVKSALVDLQDLFATFGRKLRIVPTAVRDSRGWDARHVGRVIVVEGTTANRRVIADHASTFAAAFPADTTAVRRWVGDPRGDVAGIWLVAPRGAGSAKVGGRARERASRGGAR